VIAPGEVVRLGEHDRNTAAAGWCVFFPPELIASDALGGSLGWRSHPLLFPFVGRAAGGAQRLPVPTAARATWSQHVAAIERELDDPRDGSTEAALAHLTLLLVSAARISVDIGHDLRHRSEPLLAAVFEFIEEHYREPISLATIAFAVGLTPGHLTTVVRRKTGRSVQRWITERRMAQARRLLRETDLNIETVAASVGYRQPSFFIKHFRRDHAITPAMWRRRTRVSDRPIQPDHRSESFRDGMRLWRNSHLAYHVFTTSNTRSAVFRCVNAAGQSQQVATIEIQGLLRSLSWRRRA
jgi:AraC-like DNA-binding protein